MSPAKTQLKRLADRLSDEDAGVVLSLGRMLARRRRTLERELEDQEDVTDVRAARGKVASVAIPAYNNVWTTYPIATVVGAANPVTARAFANYVRFTPSAQGILRAYGFARPW